MNIYNKLYFLEYSKDPYYNEQFCIKYWFMNLSMENCDSLHREFDLNVLIKKDGVVRYWFIYDNKHRLIGPAMVEKSQISITGYHYYLEYHIRDKYLRYEHL